MPFTDEGPNGLGKLLAENGDWVVEPPADNGVVAVDGLDPNAGTGGI